MTPHRHPAPAAALLRAGGRPGGRLRAAVMVVALVGSSMVQAGLSHADGVTDAQANLDATLNELDNLRDQLGQLDEEYGQAMDRKGELDVEIAAAQADVDRMTVELGGAEAVLQDIALSRFMAGGSTEMSPVFSDASAYSAAEQRDALSRLASDSGEANVDDINALLDDLTDARDVLSAKLAEAGNLISFLDDKRNEFSALEEQYLEKYDAAKRALGEAKLEAAEEARAQASATNRTRNTAYSGGGGSSSGGSVSVPPVSGKAGIAVNAALSQLGVPYRFAAEEPGVAFDCSGLTKWAWGQAGVYLPHQSAAQYRAVPHVPINMAQPGDLIFYYSPIGHVGLYIGNGRMVHAPQTGSYVSITNVRWYKGGGGGRPG
ncbi:MAG: NlpC/P60 family protein [Ilumatobacteraceae bacterium]